MRRDAGGLFAVVISIIAFGSSASAQEFPKRTITLVNGYAAGGPIDIAARGLAQKLSELWGVSVVVDNRPGANEVNAALAVTKATPDGYTLLFASDSAASLNPLLFRKLPYDPTKELAPISRLFSVNMGLVVPGTLPVKDLAGYVALMKAEGSKYNYGSSSSGSTTHLGFEAIQQSLGFKLTHLPYKGIAPALQDMLGGTVHGMIAGLSAFSGYTANGQVKVLAVSGPTRWSALPDVPTFTELGHPEIVVGFYAGVFAPAGTPKDVVEKILSGIQAAQRDKAFVKRFIAPFDYRLNIETPADFAGFLDEDRARSKARIQAAKIETFD